MSIHILITISIYLRHFLHQKVTTDVHFLVQNSDVLFISDGVRSMKLQFCLKVVSVSVTQKFPQHAHNNFHIHSALFVSKVNTDVHLLVQNSKVLFISDGVRSMKLQFCLKVVSVSVTPKFPQHAHNNFHIPSTLVARSPRCLHQS